MARPEKWDDTFPAIAAAAAKFGATDREIAEVLGISERTLNYWKKDHPELVEALKVGKDAADERVVQSLYRKATGYSFDAEKIFQNKGEVIRAPYVEHVPPSDTAAIFWLKNRRKDDWRDKHEVEHGASSDLKSFLERIAANGKRIHDKG